MRHERCWFCYSVEFVLALASPTGIYHGKVPLFEGHSGPWGRYKDAFCGRLSAVAYFFCLVNVLRDLRCCLVIGCCIDCKLQVSMCDVPPAWVVKHVPGWTNAPWATLSNHMRQEPTAVQMTGRSACNTYGSGAASCTWDIHERDTGKHSMMDALDPHRNR